MNYSNIYSSLISRAKDISLIGYVENHHIIPRCMGGDDSSVNLVKLTAREHFIAHLLLVKIYPNNLKLVKAAAMMCIGQPERKKSNRLYGILRIKFSESMSESQQGEKNSQYGSRWIHNSATLESAKLRTSDILKEGWVLGRLPKRQKELTSIINREALITLHRQYYEIYNTVGFTEFVKITRYKHSKQNLVQRFAKLLNEFQPQNRKRRGIHQI